MTQTFGNLKKIAEKHANDGKDMTGKAYVNGIRNIFGNNGANAAPVKENIAKIHSTGSEENMFGKYTRSPFEKIKNGKFMKGWNKLFPNENPVKDYRGMVTPAYVPEKEEKYRTPANVGAEKSKVEEKILVYDKSGKPLSTDEVQTVYERTGINYKPFAFGVGVIAASIILSHLPTGREGHKNLETKVIEKTNTIVEKEKTPAWVQDLLNKKHIPDTVIVEYVGKDNPANIAIISNSNNTNCYNKEMADYNKGLEGKTPDMRF